MEGETHLKLSSLEYVKLTICKRKNSDEKQLQQISTLIHTVQSVVITHVICQIHLCTSC